MQIQMEGRALEHIDSLYQEKRFAFPLDSRYSAEAQWLVFSYVIRDWIVSFEMEVDFITDTRK